jgi:class 3 adenylate cyclase
MHMPDLPTGTVTFVFSDLEGSTRLLKQLGDEGYAAMLATHRRIVRETFAEFGGSEIDTQGDAFFYGFSRARAAVAAAVKVQRRHEAEEWPNGERVRARMGLHTGEPVVGEEGYTGLDVVRAARIAADGDGGQILLSESTRAIVGDDLPEGVDVRELGERRLKDLDRPEPLYELVYSPDEPSPEPPDLPQVPDPELNLNLDPTNVSGWLDIARQAMRQGDTFNPGPMIEQRVLRQIEENMRRSEERRATKNAAKSDKQKSRSNEIPGPPDFPPLPDFGQATPAKKKSVADELERLRALKDQGALSDEQYGRAVDRVLGEG